MFQGIELQEGSIQIKVLIIFFLTESIYFKNRNNNICWHFSNKNWINKNIKSKKESKRKIKRK